VCSSDLNLLFASGTTVQITGSLCISGSIKNNDSIDFNISSSLDNKEGRLTWNDNDGTLNLGLKGGVVNLQIGQEQVIRVINKTGSDLLESEYKVVRVRNSSEGGAQGQRLAVVLAQANIKSNYSDILGLVTENINNNQSGFITSNGLINNINTTGGSENWQDGDILYLSETNAGSVTNIKPLNNPIQIGYVIYAHSNEGKIYVKLDLGVNTLDDLFNININNPTDNQILTYISGTWINKNHKSSGIDDINSGNGVTGVTIETLDKVYHLTPNTLTNGHLDFSIYSIRETGASLAHQVVVRVNNVNNFATATEIFRSTTGGNFSPHLRSQRKFTLKNNLIRNINITSTTDLGASGTGISVPFNLSGDLYIFFSTIPGATNQVIKYDSIQIKQL
jgi:hypothetical protein